MELLEVVQVKVIGSEKIRGVDCYVLQLTPDMEQLWQLAMQQSGATGETLPDVGEEFLQEVFKNFSIKQWVAKDTYFLTKAEIYMAMELTPEALGYPEEEGLVTMDITMDLLAYNYNQPVSIELPPEAEEAVEVPMYASEEEELDVEYHNIQVAVAAMLLDADATTLDDPGTGFYDEVDTLLDVQGVTCGGGTHSLHDYLPVDEYPLKQAYDIALDGEVTID
jgi:hypothetical protein